MDNLEFNPDEFHHLDTTFETEGYAEQLESIEGAYPEQDFRMPDEIAAEEGESETSAPIEDKTDLSTPVADKENLETKKAAIVDPRGELIADPETGLIPLEQLKHRNGQPIRSEIIANQRLQYGIIPQEAEVRELIEDDLNLESQWKAYQMIKSNPELEIRMDRNGDGVYTFADMFDMHRWNNGKGMTAEQDAAATADWEQSIQDKDFSARLGAVFQAWLPGSNMTKVQIDRRKLALAKLEDIPNPFSKPGQANMDEVQLANLLKWAKDTASLPEQLISFVTGGDFGGHDAKLDDWLFGHKNPNSFAFTVNNPTYRQKFDGAAGELAYWGPEAIIAGLTLGAGSKGLMSLSQKLSKPSARLAMMKTARFIDPAISTRAYATAGTGIRGTIFGKTSVQALKSGTRIKAKHWAGKLKNLSTTSLKAGALETFKASMTRDLTEDGYGVIYNEDGLARQIIDAYPDTAMFGREMQWAIETPLGKRYAYWFDESVQDGVAAGGLFGIFGGFGRAVAGTYNLGRHSRAVLPEVLSLPQRELNKFRSSTTQWSTWNGHKAKDARHWFGIRQQKLLDKQEAAEVQLSLFDDGPSNPYFRSEGTPVQQASTYGAYKNDPQMLGQGTIPTRSNVNQIVNDADEIATNVVKRPGTTDSLFSPLQIREGADAGIGNDLRVKLTKEFVEDSTRAAQIKSLDPAKRTTIGMNEGTLKRMMETIDRDAASLDPKEFWGEIIADEPLSTGAFANLNPVKAWSVQNMQVADAINQSLLLQLRDMAAATSHMSNKTDIFAVDGPMKRVADNLILGLTEVKRTRATLKMMQDLMAESNGELTEDMVQAVSKQIGERSRGLHDETADGVKLMMQMLENSDSKELAHGVLEVFRTSNDIHNWKDFDAWMRSKISGGEFNGKANTGALLGELQSVMINSILSGPKTPLRAILGTTTNAYYNALNEAAGAFIKAPFTDDVISRTASYAKLKSMIEILPEAWQVFKRNLDGKFKADFADIRTRYNEPPNQADMNFELFKTWTERNGTNGDKAAMYALNTARTLNNNKLLSWSPRVLAATDDTFKWLLARARSKEKAIREVLDAGEWNGKSFDAGQLKQIEDNHYRNLLDNDGNLDLSKDSWLNKQFKEVTLTSELKGFSEKLDKVFNDYPLIKPFYLFARTGINGLNLSYKNTPLLGALHKESIAILKHQGDDFTPLMKYGIENAADLTNARNLFAGRQAVGATVVTGMGLMYQANQLTGNGPADKQLKQNMINAGWKPNHIYVGDVGFDYSSLEPFNVIFSSIADIGDNMELMGSEWAEKRLQAVAFVLGRGLTGKTYMSGLDQLMQIVQNPAGPATSKAVANIFNNSIPLAGVRNEFGKFINPHLKELNSDMWSSIRNRNQGLEILAAKPLPEKSDLLNGKPINNWNFIGRAFNAVSPISLDVRSDSPGRKLLLESNYDLKSTTYSYGGYSFVEDNHVRAHFQNEIGKAPITIYNRKFKNVEEALTYLSTRKDIKLSMREMQNNVNNPSKWNINPNTYPHNTLIDNIMNQARAKAWARINQPDHPGYQDVQALKAKKDGKDADTRNNRQEILNLSFPEKSIESFPKVN